MDLIKKILASIIIVIGLAFVGVMICASILFFIPSANIFGFSYTSSKTQDTHLITYVTSLNKIQINTYSFDVKITHTDETNKVVLFYINETQGFYNNEISQAVVDYSYTDEGHTFVVNVSEPQGLMFARSTYVEVRLPEGIDVDDVEITTNKGSVYVGDAETFNCKTLSITCDNVMSNINIQKSNVADQLTIRNIAGNVTVDSDITASVHLMTDYGTFTFKSVGDLLDTSGKIFLVEGNNAGITNPSITAESIYNDFSYNAESGLIRIDNIYGTCLLTSSNVSFNAESIYGRLNLTGGASQVNIDNLGTGLEEEESLAARINSVDGNIYIKNTLNKVVLVTNRGTVKIDNAQNDVDIETVYGAVTVAFKQVAEGYTGGKILKIRSNNGTINATHISGVVDIVSTNSVTNVQFDSLSGTNTIVGGAQKITIDTPILKYSLITQSINGRVDVELGSVEYNTWTPTSPNMTASTTQIEGVEFKVVSSYVNFDNDPLNAEYTNNTLTVRSTNGTIEVK